MDAARRLDSKSCSDPQHFPLTLGRDFSGVVVDTGKAVNTLKPGDEVICSTLYCLNVIVKHSISYNCTKTLPRDGHVMFIFI